MAYYLQWSADTGNKNTNTESLEISGITGNLVSVQYTLAKDMPAVGQTRYLFDSRLNGGSPLKYLLQLSNGATQETVTNGTINGNSVSLVSLFNALEGDVCKFDVGMNPGGSVTFGARFNRVESSYGMAVSEMVLIDDAGTHTINMSDSGGTGSSVTSDTGNLTAALVNFPTDNSQWVFYDDGSGVDPVTANGSYTLPLLTLDALGSATVPAPTGDIDYAIPSLTLSASGTATLPQPNGDIAVTLPRLTIDASGSAALPQPAGDISVTLPSLTIDSSGTASLPQPIGTADYSLPTLTISGTATASLPNPTGDVNYTLSAVTISSVGSATITAADANGSYTLPRLTVAATGSATLTNATVDGNITLPGLTVSASGRQHYHSQTVMLVTQSLC